MRKGSDHGMGFAGESGDWAAAPGPRQVADCLEFANLRFHGLSRQSLFRPEGRLKQIVTVNAEFIVRANEDPRFRDIICRNHATFDGQVPFVIARLLNPGLAFEKISGSDLVYTICERCRDNSWSMFLLGGSGESNAGAVGRIAERYGIRVAGYSPPHEPYPFSRPNNEEMLRRVSAFAPDFLLVGFGAAKQEFWIDDNRSLLEEAGVRWAIGVGGSFDFVSGKISRAPGWCQRAGLEGVYRLLMEPRWFRLARLWKSLYFFKYLFGRNRRPHGGPQP